MTRTEKNSHWVRPIDFDYLASVLQARSIDIAPTFASWKTCAREIADAWGEKGRKAFHRIANVWPFYSFSDSDACFDKALSRSNDDASCPYIRSMIKKYLNANNPLLYKGKYFLLKKLEVKQTKRKIMEIDLDFFLSTTRDGRSIKGRNALTDLLLRLYPETAVLQAVDRYCIGFDSFVNGAMEQPIIFWQINEKCNIINGKRIQYKFDGHRDKKIAPRIMYPMNPTTLFGLHLQPMVTDRGVGVVESEKTALIMSIEMPEMVWMAVGGLNNFNEITLNPLRMNRITAYPDLDITIDRKTHRSASWAEWNRTAIALQRKGWRISTSTFIEDRASSLDRMNKLDISDFVLRERINNFKSGK